jgi:CheY-like chemotaxis protein
VPRGGRDLPESRILIVDDNATNLKVLRATLEGRGYRLVSAASAEEALGLLELEWPDLILLDIELPGMDGLELARRVKQEPGRPSIVVLAVTSFAAPADEARALAAGCDGFVRKPIDTRAFPDIVAHALLLRNGAGSCVTARFTACPDPASGA